MSRNSTFTNDKLPDDVLGDIFQDFAAMETAEDSVEKLLLVCKNWNFAARSHRSIWRIVTVTIEHERTFSSCISYATRRLALSGSSVPLDICIHTSPLFARHEPVSEGTGDFLVDTCCSEAAVSITEKILNILAGSNGEECRRWERLYLSFDLNNQAIEMTSLHNFNALKYPMPILKYLLLVRFTSTGEIFRHCPSLVDVHMEDVRMSSLSIFQNAQNISIVYRYLSIVDLSSLTGTGRMEKLELWFSDPDGIFLPPSLPSVSSFYIGGSDFPDSFDLQLPSLTDLEIDYNSPFDSEKIVDCSGIPFPQIERLEVCWDGSAMEDMLDLENILWRLLSKCTALREVTLSTLSFIALLKLMWERCCRVGGGSVERPVSPWGSRTVKVQMWKLRSDKRIEFSISGAEDKETLSRFAEKAGISYLGASWGEMWKLIEE